MAKTTTTKAVATVKPTTKAIKFTKDSVEGTMVRDMKSRQKKIDRAGFTLAGLWYEQGTELTELQTILECSERALEKHTGIKRSAINAYIKISNDPRLGEPEVTAKLGNFTQKELMKLGELDEDNFNKAIEDGVLPKSETTPKPTAEKVDEPADELWKREMLSIVANAKSRDEAEEKLLAYFGTDVEIIEEDEPQTLDEVNPDRALLLDALAKTGESDAKSQSLELDITEKQLDKALNEDKITEKIIAKCQAYLAE